MSAPTIDEVVREIAERFPAWQAGAPAVVASGMEATVYRVETRLHGPLAVKVFAARMIHNDNDRDLDARDLLRQDALAYEHLLAHGLPAPHVVSLHFGERIDLLAYRFIDVDGAGCPARAIGRLVRALHEAPTPSFLPVAHRGSERFEAVAATLIAERVDVVRRLAGEALPALSLPALEASLAAAIGPRPLLHMDARPANLLCRDGRVEAWIDWSNAIVAHPVFELARIAEYGLPYDEIVDGYGEDPLARVAPHTAVAARIYTAAMLAVVHLSEAPNPARANIAVNRLRALIQQYLQYRQESP